MPTPDPHALLCERCGYVIDGLDDGPPAPACPECGLALAESSGAKRPGSPWQRQPDYVGWLRTMRDIHLRPTKMFRALRVAPETDTRLQIVNQLLMPALVVPGFWFVMSRGSMAASPMEVLLFAVVFASMTAPVTLLLGWIEKRGVIFFAAKRGWRIPEPLARSIINHCTLTWFWAWYGLVLGVLIGPVLDRQLSRVATNTLIDAMLPVAPPLLGFIAGMLVFETLVYVAVRQCRFANVPDEKGPSITPLQHTP
ncbi:MAG: hypothetical protein K2W85_03140 [Phycisphaerales bacterium]|nr:hypothetical protein [Phycisphaerales bacterium]